MNRARIIFIVLSIYIFASSAWWTYAHFKSNTTIYNQQKEIEENLCYKATLDVQGALNQELFYDSTGMKNYFNSNYPNHELIFLSKDDPLNNFMIRPRYETYQNLEKIYYRKLVMYIAEGLVMIALLFWGMMWIYRSFEKEISLKKQQTNFLLSVTHELKTPITAIKLYMETLLMRKVSPEQSHIIIENSLNDAGRLQDLAENLLLSAQLDAKKYELQWVETNLSELIEETVENFSKPRNLSNRISLSLQEQVIDRVDPSAIEMILNNLLTNAFKYTGESSVVCVNLKQLKGQTILQVSDDGPGIEAADRIKLFSKFFRVGDENTRKTKGTGLGLFIVKNLVDLHKADISIENKRPNGTIFEIRFKTHAT